MKRTLRKMGMLSVDFMKINISQWRGILSYIPSSVLVREDFRGVLVHEASVMLSLSGYAGFYQHLGDRVRDQYPRIHLFVL